MNDCYQYARREGERISYKHHICSCGGPKGEFLKFLQIAFYICVSYIYIDKLILKRSMMQFEYHPEEGNRLIIDS
jgi:hypothetical protein